ncbi:Eukaryotic translation initiation factor 3 subunit K [Fasciola hepatica]|uniref:Eukaryotic translation initiation factor 3 subunit K n=1 Tax=Fasciola hepatica TaxID=6192 RepID=A0A4E0S048_FASHE|nr:Eukaryotic translation initiation factor 3 subunit K [Fasciola hepatica]
MDQKAVIKRLLHGIESYNPEHRSVLEKHVQWQVSQGEYDFESNLVLLRLYQFYPEHYNSDITKLILLKALASSNPTDFTLCKYLIQLDHLDEEPVSLVVEMGTLLEACNFPEFWVGIFANIMIWQQRLRENPNVCVGVPGFRESMLNFVIQVVSQTYQRIPKALLVSILNVTDQELRQLMKTHGWTECSLDPKDPHHSGPLILVNKHEEHVKSVKIQERVTFDSITSMSGAFRPSKGDFFIKTG